MNRKRTSQALNRADCSRAVHGFRGTCVTVAPLTGRRRHLLAVCSYQAVQCSGEGLPCPTNLIAT